MTAAPWLTDEAVRAAIEFAKLESKHFNWGGVHEDTWPASLDALAEVAWRAGVAAAAQICEKRSENIRARGQASCAEWVLGDAETIRYRLLPQPERSETP